jgi:ubiquinone/menaquinone biosynthesis C-methylase UbiE
VSADERLARSFGSVAELYDRVRPDYSQESLDRAQAALELDDAAKVLDLAAGTGRLTVELARRFAHVVAVEPDDAMRSLIPAGEVLAGTAESIPLADESVDAVFVGEAFHWFDPGPAVAEVARVLRPRGGVALFSNLWWETEPPVPERAAELLREPYVLSGRAGAVETWREAFAAHGAFEPLRDETFAWRLDVDADRLLEMYETTSSIASLPQGERAALVANVRPLLADRYRLPIHVELTWTRRVSKGTATPPGGGGVGG